MSAVLDIALVLLLLAYLVGGYRRGLIRSLGALVGILAGALGAGALSPVVASMLGDGPGRTVAVIVVACVLVLAGHAAGAAVGALLGGRIRRGPLGVVERLLGAALNVVVAALVVSVLASAVTALGVPFLARPIAESAVLRAIDGATPAPVDSALAQVRTSLLRTGLPQLGRALGGPASPPAVPVFDTSNAALTRAAASVVKLTGTAYACGQDQSGSGFVVAPDRVLTNAHVLTGVDSPVVLAPDGRALVGRIVHLDRRADLAVVAVHGLGLDPLSLAAPPAAGATAVVDGYPLGGPFATSSARVLTVGDLRVPDGGGGGSSTRRVATLAADVEQGDSGGPLLTRTGRVLGLVFAKSATTKDVGFAMTTDAFRPLVARSASLTTRVPAGACSKD